MEFEKRVTFFWFDFEGDFPPHDFYYTHPKITIFKRKGLLIE